MRKPRVPKFPLEARINVYGFIHMRGKWLTALSWHVDMPLKIEKNADGSIAVRKAQFFWQRLSNIMFFAKNDAKTMLRIV